MFASIKATPKLQLVASLLHFLPYFFLSPTEWRAARCWALIAIWPIRQSAAVLALVSISPSFPAPRDAPLAGVLVDALLAH
jgi:hypothetical protein